VARGILRSREDDLRAAVIRSIICTLGLDFATAADDWDIDVGGHFADALAQLEEPVSDGLVEVSDAGLRVTPRGRFFLRNICMPFDAYLAAPGDRPVYSRTV
jgi:oxygen-independent coproporphyrinogen-3 oxidase